MAEVSPRRRATVGELIGLLAPIPSDTPIILITECHGCAEWLDGFTYDADTNRVELSASC